MSHDSARFDPAAGGHLPLRLFQPEPLDQSGGSSDGGVSPEMSLTDVFERWMVPVLFRKSSAGTLTKYRDSLAWWRRLTGDPAVVETDDYTLVRFETGLEKAVWKRGKHGIPRPLSQFSRRGHLARINTLLGATGPRIDRRRPTAGLVAAPPQLAVESADADASPPFELARAREIYLAIEQIDGTRKMPATVFRQCLRGLLSLLYYTGLRIGTVLELRWEHAEERDGDTWLKIPAEIVSKTGKPLEKYLRPEALAAVSRLRLLSGNTSTRLIPWMHHKRWLAELHGRLQLLAGVPQDEVLSPHAWRRTHATEMGKLGAEVAYKVAQLSMDHASDRTTRKWYAQLEPHLIRQLPAIEPTEQAGQKWLF